MVVFYTYSAKCSVTSFFSILGIRYKLHCMGSYATKQSLSPMLDAIQRRRSSITIAQLSHG